MNNMVDVTLAPLAEEDIEEFIADNQEAFNYGALEEFGLRDDHFEEDGEIISAKTIESAIHGGEAYRIISGGRKVGGVVVRVEGNFGDLELLFVSPKVHSKGIGYAAWCEIEKMYPQVKVWETVRHTLKSAIFIFMLIDVVFTSLSSTTVTTPIQMIRMRQMLMVNSFQMVCSASKRK